MSLESSRDPSAPFVTFYDGATGERTELSGTSFANWRAKTANHLRDGIGLSAADRIDLRLPLHWVVPVWLAAARDLGVTVSIASDAGLSEPADLAVVGPQTLADAPTNCDVVACSLRPLAAPSPTDYPSESRISSPKSATSATTSLRPIEVGPQIHCSTSEMRTSTLPGFTRPLRPKSVT